MSQVQLLWPLARVHPNCSPQSLVSPPTLNSSLNLRRRFRGKGRCRYWNNCWLGRVQHSSHYWFMCTFMWQGTLCSLLVQSTDSSLKHGTLNFRLTNFLADPVELVAPVAWFLILPGLDCHSYCNNVRFGDLLVGGWNYARILHWLHRRYEVSLIAVRSVV